MRPQSKNGLWRIAGDCVQGREELLANQAHIQE